MEKNNSIVVMLDIRGTLDGMTPEKVKYFFALLDNVRLFYNASTIKLFFSSFDKNPDGIRKYFNIMKDYIPNTMEIGNSYYRCGNYDCLNNKEEFISDTYNYDKDALLEENYIDDSVKWFGIFDDKQDSEYVKCFKEVRPMAVFRASLKEKENFSNDNIMCYTTSTFGFDGCIENLEKYLYMLEEHIGEDMVTVQKEALFNFDDEIRYRVLHITNDFKLLLRYIEADKCSQDDYNYVLRFLAAYVRSASSEELVTINRIVEVIISKINWNYNYNRSYYAQLSLELRNHGF